MRVRLDSSTVSSRIYHQPQTESKPESTGDTFIANTHKSAYLSGAIRVVFMARITASTQTSLGTHMQKGYRGVLSSPSLARSHKA